MSFKNLITISRPRFWLYLFGPFLIGVAAAPLAVSLPLLLLAIYFTLPANLLIYGVNDLFDYETDKLNPKKRGYEEMVTPERQKNLRNYILAFNVPFLALLPFLPSVAIYSLLLFWFFGIFYSAKPIRAKTKPIIDSFFNILYIFPGLVAFGIGASKWPNIAIIISGTLWCMAMHAFSAVPDIASDKKAHMRTIATLLGRSGTIVFCMLAYVLAAVLVWQYIGWYSALCGLIYAGMMLLALKTKDTQKLFKLYTYFPVINAVLGFGLFVLTVLAQ